MTKNCPSYNVYRLVAFPICNLCSILFSIIQLSFWMQIKTNYYYYYLYFFIAEAKIEALLCP